MNNKKQIELGTKKISSLLIKMSVPAVISMLVNGLYHIVDAIFIGQGVDREALGGLAIVFPLQMFFIAIGTFLGMGSASIISRNLGSGNFEKANNVTGNVFISSVVLGIILTFVIILFIEPMLELFGSPPTGVLHDYAKEYLSYILYGVVFTFFSMSGNSVARAEGNAKIAMLSMIIGIGTNIVLDAIFIFGFLMGVKGAAIATVISKLISTIILILYFLSGKSNLSIKFHHLKLNLNLLMEIAILGLPAFLRQTGTSVLAIVVNNSLTFYGEIYLPIYGVIIKILTFFVLPLLGIGQGFHPIVGFNYGAKNPKRVREAIKLTIRVLIIIASIFFTVLILFSKQILNIFNNDNDFIRLGIEPLRIIILLFPLRSIQILSSVFFQSIGKVLPSFILTISQRILFLIPLILILPGYFGLKGLWFAFPISDALSIIISFIWLKWTIDKSPSLKIKQDAATKTSY